MGTKLITVSLFNNNTQFVERRGAIASEALADRSSQLARNRREKMSFKSTFK